METARQNLNLLITKLDTSFPDEVDLKGFPGISKVAITDSLTQSGGLLVAMKEYENLFDAIILKRNLDGLFKKIEKELNEPFEKITSEKFNNILKLISTVRTSIRETYASLVNNVTLRTEAEIVKSKEELESLTNAINQVKESKEEIDILKDVVKNSLEESQLNTTEARNAAIASIAKVNEVIEEQKTISTAKITELTAELSKNEKIINKVMNNIDAKLKKLNDSEVVVNKFVSEVDATKILIEETAKSVAHWKSDINLTTLEIKKLSGDYSELSSKSSSLKSEIEVNHERLVGKKDVEGKVVKAGYLQETEQLKSKLTVFLQDLEKKTKAQFVEIEGLLPGATSAGLAEAYQKQKSSYTIPMRLWSWVFILTMVLMAVFSIYLLVNQLAAKSTPTLNDALIALLRDLPFFIPTIWLAGYASKQQSQYKRLQQEYAFKETNAKSFHGHKMQIEELLENSETDAQLLTQLVAQLVFITAQNPSETLDSKAHDDSPPLFKLIEKYLPSLKGKGVSKVPPSA